MAQYGLEPYYATYESEFDDEKTTLLAGLRLDSVNALLDMGAFDNREAILCVYGGSTNTQTVLKVLEIMIEDLTTGGYADAATEGTQPAA